MEEISMKNRFKHKVMLIFCLLIINYCSVFFILASQGFLDCNQKYLDKQNQTKIETGYIFNGSDADAKKIGTKCANQYKGNPELQEKCLLQNGFKRAAYK